MSLDERFGVIDDVTGSYTQLGSLPVEQSYGIANYGGSLYIQDNTGMLLRLDDISGQAMVMGSAGISTPTALFAGGSNGLFEIDYGSVLWSISAIDGHATRIGATGLKPNNGMWETSLASDGTNLWFTAGDGSQIYDDLFRIDPLTGRATRIGNTGVMGISGSAIVNGNLELFQYHWDEELSYIFSAPLGSTSFTRGAMLDFNVNSGGTVWAGHSVTLPTVTSSSATTPEPTTILQMTFGCFLLFASKSLKKR